MEKLKKLSLRKRKPSSSSNASQGSTGARTRRHALIQPFTNRTEKHQIKQYQSAVESGDAVRVREILESGLDIMEIDEDSESLRFACTNAHTEVAAVLLRYGALINEVGDSGTGPIHIAARQGNAGLLALIVSQGALINLPTKFEKKTALHMSTLHGKDSVVRLLLDNNAQVDGTDIYGTTPLQLAARMGRVSTLEILLSHDPDVNLYDNDGWTALHLAADSGNLDIAKLLLQNHGQVDAQNKYGRTPLHWACTKGHLNMVQLLIDYRAAIDIKDLNGKTAMDYSKDKHITTLLKLNYQDKLKGNIKTGPVGTIGQYITIDPRESMIQKVFGQNNKRDTVNGNVYSTDLKNTTISEDDEFDSVSDTNSNVIWMTKTSVARSVSEIGDLTPNGDADKISICNSISSQSQGGSFISPTNSMTSTSTPIIGRSISTNVVEGSLAGTGSDQLDTYSKPMSGSSRLSVKSTSSSDTHSSSAQFRDFTEGRDMFKSFINALSAHNEKLSKDIQFMYNDISKTLLTSDKETQGECLKGARARLELMVNCMFDFQEETESQSDKLRGKMTEFIEKAKERFTNTNSLEPRHYIALFHSIGKYLCTKNGEWKKVIKGLARGSVEAEYDMEKEVNSAGENENDKVYKCMSFLVRRTGPKDIPFIKELLDFLTNTCGLGNEAKLYIMRDYINFITSHKATNLNTTQMNLISEELQKKGVELWRRLGIKITNEDEFEWSTIKNMNMFSEWRTITSSSSIIDRICSLTDAIIEVEMESLLSIVFMND